MFRFLLFYGFRVCGPLEEPSSRPTLKSTRSFKYMHPTDAVFVEGCLAICKKIDDLISFALQGPKPSTPKP